MLPQKSIEEIDTSAVQAHRTTQIQRRLQEQNCPAIVLFDPINIRYATATRNMQVWTMHNFVRYAVIFASGASVLYDMPSSAHLAYGYVDDVRPSLSADFMIVGGRGEEIAKRWVAEILSLLAEKSAGDKTIAIDRADLLLVSASQRQGLSLTDGKAIMERARAIKSLEEISALKASLCTCENAVAVMRAQIRPGMSESGALAVMLQSSVEQGGEYPETRLLSSGPRTNPWFQETSDRVIENGDMLAFDTDLIGPLGFYNDISRSWVVGDKKPTDQQRRLYSIAYEQMIHNTRLLKPGMEFLDYSDQSYQLPDNCVPNRYADVAHGCGLGVEYPLIWYREDEEWGAYNGVFEENMVVCVECYVGEVGGTEGVKLEQPVWLSQQGPVPLSAYPFELDYL